MKNQFICLSYAAITLTLAALLTGCATYSTERVSPEEILQPHKGAARKEFIGFADGHAFETVTLIPFAPWSIPKTVIRRCPLYELEPKEIETLKSRIKTP